jgi:hypothetical protein
MHISKSRDTAKEDTSNSRDARNCMKTSNSMTAGTTRKTSDSRDFNNSLYEHPQPQLGRLQQKELQ